MAVNTSDPCSNDVFSWSEVSFVWMPTNNETSLNLPKLIRKSSARQNYDTMPPPSFPWKANSQDFHVTFVSSSMFLCLVQLSVSHFCRNADLWFVSVWGTRSGVSHTLSPSRAWSRLLSDKNKKYGTAAERREESFGKKITVCYKKIIPCIYTHGVHKYANVCENIRIDIKSQHLPFCYKLHTAL